MDSYAKGYTNRKAQLAKEKIEAGDRGGSFVFGSIVELCSYIGISDVSYRNNKIDVLDCGFQVVRLDLGRKIQIAKGKIEAGDRGGSFIFENISQLAEYIGASWSACKKGKDKLLNAGFLVNEYLSPEEKMKIAKGKIEAGDRDGSFVFETVREFCDYLEVSWEAYRDHKKMFLNEGFQIDILTPDKKIEIAKDKIEAGDRGGSFVFSHASQACEYIGVSNNTYKKYKEQIRDAGFVVKVEPTIERCIEIAKEKIEAGDRGGSFVFENISQLAEYIGASWSACKKGKDKLLNAGFLVNEYLSPEEKMKIAKGKIEAGDRDGSFVFGYASQVSEYIGVSQETYKKYKEQILDAGFRVEAEPITEHRLRVAKEKIEAGDRDGSFVFEKLKDLIGYLDISSSAYFNNKEKIAEVGFRLDLVTVEKKIEIAKEKIEAGDRDGSFVFKSVQEIHRYIGISWRTYLNNEEEILRAGFATGTGFSKNTQLSIQDCQSYGIRLEDPSLLPLISQEFFSRSMRTEMDDLSALLECDDVFSNFDTKEINSKVKNAALRLISKEKNDYSMLEMKLELLSEGAYLSEDTIVRTLLNLGEDIGEVFKDNIHKRLRMCISFVEKGFIEVEYADSLPLINNSDEGRVIVDKRIDNKQSLMALWREYVEFSVKNDITGHVSKTKLPNDWNGGIDALFEKIPSYKRAYLLDDINVQYLERMGYEGLLAMCQFGSKQSKKGLTRMYQSIHARCIGFFLYLNKKGLALFHPKYFIFTGASSVSDAARKILEGHIVLESFEKIENSPHIPYTDREKLKRSSVSLHALKLAGSTMEGCDLQAISAEDIFSYLKHSGQELISGTIQHETFVLTFLRSCGNRNAVERSVVFDINEEIGRASTYAGVKKDTLSVYRKLLGEMLDVVKHLYKNGKSNGYIKSYLKQIFNLMSYLSMFPEKLKRKEMIEALNTIITFKSRVPFEEWATDRLSRSEYAEFTQRMYVLFESISDSEYAKLYNKEWRVFKNKNSTRTLIREGMDAIVYETLQRVALYDAPNAYEYPFYKTTPSGEIIDLGWWKYDFSPVPVICNWLIVKLTRRKVSVRHLDVNTFLQYENGQIKSIFFNTDKNRSSQDREIGVHLLRFIFSEDELLLLEKYVEYVKSAYSNMLKVPYSNAGNTYEDIMPLFPHHERNAVIADTWVDGYFNKCMLKTEFLLKEYIAKGEYDRYFEEHDREVRKEALFCTTLLHKKGSSKKELPARLEELDSCSIPSYDSQFTTIQGIHNMRHAGISSLGVKLPLVYVRIIAGHRDINTTARIYFHANDEIIAKEVLDSEFNSLSEPAKTGSSFIEKRIMPLIESSDPDSIEDELKSNNFMTFPREVTVGPKRQWVRNGVELASGIHPASWTTYNHAICPNGGQCPVESRGCCGLCPYALFSPMHLKGVSYQLNKCLLDADLIGQKVAMDATRNINTSREELNLKHQHVMEEMVGWMQVMDSIIEKIRSDEGGDGGALLSVKTAGNTGNIVSFRNCSIDESIMEQLVDASELKINSVDTDNYIARISSKMLRKAIRDGNPDVALRRMEKDEMKRLVNEYGKKTFLEKKEFLLRELGSDEPIDNSPSLDAGSDVVELLPVG